MSVSAETATSASPESPLLEMAGITKRFPGVLALRDVSLSVLPGEIVALIGENGAGKSTLMKILGGVYQPDEGTIRIGGRPVPIRSVSDAMRLGIGFIHQELNVLPNLDVGANVFLGREPTTGGPLKIVDRRRIENETALLLERLGLAVSPRLLMSRLSLAQQQMVEIAKTLGQNARLLIMDEPTSSLTLRETDRLLAVCQELRAGGVSIIYISHRLGEITQIADRVVGLRDGQNAGMLAKGEIRHDNMVRLMVGRTLEKRETQPVTAGVPVLRVRDLRTERYPNQPVSLEVRRGEILGIAGLVGAGRSEMAHAIFGVEPALGGTLELNEQPITVRSPRDAIRHGIYLIPEDRRHTGLLTDLTVRENISLPGLRRYATPLIGLIRRAKEKEVADEQVRSLRVKTPSSETRAGNLSGGNQQKVVLGKWLALDPKVILFDEPTRGIDVGAKAEIYDLMRALAERGVGVLMISSDMEEVLLVADRVAVMHEGGVTGILDRDDMNEENIMRLAVGSLRGVAA